MSRFPSTMWNMSDNGDKRGARRIPDTISSPRIHERSSGGLTVCISSRVD